jgi:hypothetical protein
VLNTGRELRAAGVKRRVADFYSVLSANQFFKLSESANRNGTTLVLGLQLIVTSRGIREISQIVKGMLKV